jgi:hypothetical protein
MIGGPEGSSYRLGTNLPLKKKRKKRKLGTNLGAKPVSPLPDRLAIDSVIHLILSIHVKIMSVVPAFS